jgi:hypothetical protein
MATGTGRIATHTVALAGGGHLKAVSGCAAAMASPTRMAILEDAAVGHAVPEGSSAKRTGGRVQPTLRHLVPESWCVIEEAVGSRGAVRRRLGLDDIFNPQYR